MKMRLVLSLAVSVAFAPAALSAAECPTDSERQAHTYIHFATGSSEISPGQEFQLDKAAKDAIGQYISNVCVYGRASKLGDNKSNDELAQARAVAVVKELTRRGVEAKNVKAMVKGEPFGGALSRLSDNSQADRAVEIQFID